MSDREVHGLRRVQVQLGIVALAAQAQQAEGTASDLGSALEVVADLGVIRQAHTGAVSGLHQDTGVETDGRVIAADLHLAVVAARSEGIRHLGSQLTVNAVDGRTKADRHLVIEGIADRGLERHDLNLAFIGEVTAGETTAIVRNQTKRHIETDTESPVFINRLDVITHWHRSQRHHIAVFLAAKGTAGMADIGFRHEQGSTCTHLLLFQARHAGRVAVNGTGIIRGGRSTGETGAHTADTLFIDCKTAGK